MPSTRSIAPQVREAHRPAAPTAAAASLKAALTDRLDDISTPDRGWMPRAPRA